MSTLQVNTIQTSAPAGVLAVRDSTNALTPIQPGAVRGTAAATPPVFQDSSGTQVGTLCRAWVNFRGRSTVSIDAAFNVSSITDGGVGNYTLNFTDAFPDINYAGTGSCSTDAIANNGFVLVSGFSSGKAVSSLSISTLAGGSTLGTAYDPISVYATIFR